MRGVPDIDIQPADWEIVRAILLRHVPHCAVWAFGSRAKRCARPYSDLDLVVVGAQPLGLDVGAALADDFAESDLPFKVDVLDWATTGMAFRKLIEAGKVVLQAGSGAATAGVQSDIPFDHANPADLKTRVAAP